MLYPDQCRHISHVLNMVLPEFDSLFAVEKVLMVAEDTLMTVHTVRTARNTRNAITDLVTTLAFKLGDHFAGLLRRLLVYVFVFPFEGQQERRRKMQQQDN